MCWPESRPDHKGLVGAAGVRPRWCAAGFRRGAERPYGDPTQYCEHASLPHLDTFALVSSSAVGALRRPRGHDLSAARRLEAGAAVIVGLLAGFAATPWDAVGVWRYRRHRPRRASLFLAPRIYRRSGERTWPSSPEPFSTHRRRPMTQVPGPAMLGRSGYAVLRESERAWFERHPCAQFGS